MRKSSPTRTKRNRDFSAPLACREKFLRFFPEGFSDPKYVEWESGYKQKAHERWVEELGRDSYRKLLVAGRYMEIAQRAIAIESRTNLLFSFEKMAIRDALKSISRRVRFRSWALRVPLRSGRPLRHMGRGARQASPKANPRADLACCDGLSVHRDAGAARFPEAERH